MPELSPFFFFLFLSAALILISLVADVVAVAPGLNHLTHAASSIARLYLSQFDLVEALTALEARISKPLRLY